MYSIAKPINAPFWHHHSPTDSADRSPKLSTLIWFYSSTQTQGPNTTFARHWKRLSNESLHWIHQHQWTLWTLQTQQINAALHPCTWLYGNQMKRHQASTNWKWVQIPAISSDVAGFDKTHSLKAYFKTIWAPYWTTHSVPSIPWMTAGIMA